MKLSYAQTEFEGCKFFPLEDVIECTYDLDFNVKKFFVDRVEVNNSGLILFLRAEYDTPALFRDIVAHVSESAKNDRQRAKDLANTRTANPIFN